MAKQLGDLTALTVLSDTDLLLVRDSAAGVDKKMLGSDLVSEVNREFRLENTDVTILDTFRNPIISMATGGSNRTVTLPTIADTQGMVVTVIKEDSAAGSVTLDGESAETINSVATIILRHQYHRITVVNNGTEWLILERKRNRIDAKSSAYTILDEDDDNFFITTGATDRIITLPTASANSGRRLTLHKVDSGTGIVTIDGEGAETVNGQPNHVLPTQYDVTDLICDGSEWFIQHFWFPTQEFDEITATEDEIFDRLKNYIPHVSDILNGQATIGRADVDVFWDYIRIKRTATNQIDFEGVEVDVSGIVLQVQNRVMTDGDATGVAGTTRIVWGP